MLALARAVAGVEGVEMEVLVEVSAASLAVERVAAQQVLEASSAGVAMAAEPSVMAPVES